MTTITIDRKFLEEVVELFDSAITARHPHEILRDIRAALAAPATAPAWHVAPTVPGVWLNSVFMNVEDVEQWYIDYQLHLECARWFGPIPPDGDKP